MSATSTLDIPKLSPEQQTILSLLAKAGSQQSFQILIESHYPLIHDQIHRSYSPDVREELFRVGREALIKAFNTYDPSKGHFGAYTKPKIIWAISRVAINRNHGMHVPRDIHPCLRCIEGLRDSLGHEPTRNEILEHCKCLKKNLNYYYLRNSLKDPLSIDEPAGSDNSDNDNLALSETIADDNAEDPQRVAQIKELVSEFLPRLDKQQQIVVTLRHGLDYRGDRTFREIGKALAVSEPTVWRTYQQALGALREFYGVSKVDKAEKRPEISRPSKSPPSRKTPAVLEKGAGF